MAVIQNINRLQDKLNRMAVRHRSDGTPSVVVGYVANYAVYVHERPAKHAPGKQHKFLEQPARELGGTLGGMVATAIRGGVKLLQALYMAGLRLQRDSQQIVPVDTGNLRGSAFTAKEDDLESIMAVSEGKLVQRQQKQSEKRAKMTVKQRKSAAKRRQKTMRGYKLS